MGNDKAKGRTCTIDGCSKKLFASGYCAMHYDRLKRDKVKQAEYTKARYEKLKRDGDPRLAQYAEKRRTPERKKEKAARDAAAYKRDRERMIKRVKEYTEINKEKVSKYQKDYKVLIRYGLTAEQYIEMVNTQNNLCAICLLPPDNCHPKKLVIDHDHETGLIRGLLCRFCNQGLGMFRDNKGIMLRAIEYLNGRA